MCARRYFESSRNMIENKLRLYLRFMVSICVSPVVCIDRSYRTPLPTNDFYARHIIGCMIDLEQWTVVGVEVAAWRRMEARRTQAFLA